jgi:hypothetical protein
MGKILKRLFKRAQKVTVHKGGRVYKFRSFEKAVAFMMAG